MALTLEQFGIDRLSPQERCELIDLLWDSLPEDAPFTPPDWRLRELERRVAAADAGERSRYGHTFGGPPRHDGARMSARLHYNFNTDDPKFGFQMPGVRWLPLYWAPSVCLTRHGHFAYRVLSDDKIEILTEA